MTKKKIELLEITLVAEGPEAFSKSRVDKDVKAMEDQGYRVIRIRKVYG